jgi:lipoprotein-anchoring transpeptidase ErfK/SrfK
MNKKAYQHAIQKAHAAMQLGEKNTARRWAQQAAALMPDREEAWLLLGALASPRASVAYLQKALEINPDSTQARKGMQWALRRHRGAKRKAAGKAPIVVEAMKPQAHVRRRSTVVPWVLAALILIFGLSTYFGTAGLFQGLTSFSTVLAQGAPVEPVVVAAAATATAIPATATATAVPATATDLPTDTPEPTSTALPTSTDTPEPTATLTPEPTETATPEPTEPPPTQVPVLALRPNGVGANEHWIDVDLTNQLTRAFKGDELVRSFVVSTGTWQTPTVTGQYRVYVKYEFADMSGPGYYLANVPYVMYFYQGYGLHGTYWHNNFGTPMSHGCINLTIDDAGWIFNFSVVGTLVNIHY